MRHERETKQPKHKTATTASLSILLAFSIAAMPLASFADEDTDTAATAEAASESVTSEDAASGAAASETTAVKHGLYAAATQTAHSNAASITTTDEAACGLFAETSATIIANNLVVGTKAGKSAAVATSSEGGSVSIANSQLSTAGSDSPILFSAGLIEADNVQGSATKSALAVIEKAGSIVLDSSTLSSSNTGSAGDSLPASAIALYREETVDATTSQVQTAQFQASRSKLESAIESGSFFYLTNTAATIVLKDNDLDFDSNKAKLVVAQGSDATSAIATATDPTAFGTTGKNGATVTFTAIDQSLKGAVVADSISSVDLYLLDGSMWTGTSAITANAAGTDLATNITVNIDATSGWIVTEDATVSVLNIAKGGKLVDADGKAVTIVDADGNKLVDGASEVKVSVTNEFSTAVKTSSANELKGASIDRTAFDAEFDTSTTFGTNGADAGQTNEERAAELQAFITDWFRSL